MRFSDCEFYSEVPKRATRCVVIDHNRIREATKAALAQLDTFEPVLQQVREVHDPVREAEERRKWDKDEEQNESGCRLLGAPFPFHYTSLTWWFDRTRMQITPLHKLSSVACAPLTVSEEDALLIADIESGLFATTADKAFINLPEVPREAQSQ
jgi:hypothetical protein